MVTVEITAAGYVQLVDRQELWCMAPDHYRLLASLQMYRQSSQGELLYTLTNFERAS